MGLGISLVVSIFNRTRLFRRSYPTWFEGKTWPDEVHILNDGGGHDLESAVDEMAARYPEVSIRYTRRDKGHDRWSNPAVPHNYLVKQAKCPIVLIIDPEIAFVTDGLPVIKEFYQDESNRSSSCSACQTYSLQKELGPLSIEQIVDYPHSLDPADRGADIIARPGTPTKGYRAWWRQRYIDLGGKDERYIGWGYEDVDLHFRQMRLPPKGMNHCATEISVVEFLHPMPGMVGSEVSRSVWGTDGEQGIPEDGVVNRGKEWGVL